MTDQSATAKPQTNVAAIIALCAGLASFLVMPYLSGTVAIIAGVVGCAKAREEETPREGMSVGGIVLGLLGIGTSLFITYILPVYL